MMVLLKHFEYKNEPMAKETENEEIKSFTENWKEKRTKT